MHRGYLIAQVTVTDPEAYAGYAKAAGELPNAWGARTLVDPNTAILVEGAPKKLTSSSNSTAWIGRRGFGQQGRPKAKALRLDAAEADFILLDEME